MPPFSWRTSNNDWKKSERIDLCSRNNNLIYLVIKTVSEFIHFVNTINLMLLTDKT